MAVERDGHKLRLWFPTLRSGRPSLLRYVAETEKMPTRIALTFFVLFSWIVSSAIAQEPATSLQPVSAIEYFHRTYEGKMGGKYPITMDLKKSGNVLKGSYQYKAKLVSSKSRERLTPRQNLP
jgi:hypothetical protein